MCAKLTFLARRKKRAGLIGPDKKDRQYLLADYVRGGQFPLADYVRGDKICGGTESTVRINVVKLHYSDLISLI